MEVAGTLLGAISVRITICNGITAYCHAWKHQDNDVRVLTALCESVKQLLQDIEQRVKSSQTLGPRITGRLQDTLDACNRHSEAVLQLTQKYAAKSTAATWKGKAEELGRRLVFPFEKKTLEELKNIMIAFRGNVDTALALIQL